MGEVPQAGDGDGYHQERTVSDVPDDGSFVRGRCYRANIGRVFSSCVFKWC